MEQKRSDLSSDLPPGRSPYGSKINLLVSGRKGGDCAPFITNLKPSFMKRPWDVLLLPNFFALPVSEKDMQFKQTQTIPGMWILFTLQFWKHWHSSHSPLSAKSLAWSCFRNRQYIGISSNPLDLPLSGLDEFHADYRSARTRQGWRNQKNFCSYCCQWNINHGCWLWHSMRPGFLYVSIPRQFG
jgi:hypothetical protein